MVERGSLRSAAAIGRRVGRVENAKKMAKHFALDIAEGVFRFRRDEASIAAEAALDGLYVVRTSVGPERLDAPGGVETYKCLSAAYVRWHLEAAWAPLLFRDEAPQERADPVGPRGRSPGALRKERDHVTPDGLPVGSFAMLMDELRTLVRNRIVPHGAPDTAAFEVLTEPTALQARALELVGVSAGSM